MNNIDIIKTFPYYIQPNSTDKYIIESGGNISEINCDLILPVLNVQYRDIYLVNQTNIEVKLYIGTSATASIGVLPAKAYIQYTPSYLGTAEYIIVGQGPITQVPVDEKLLYLQLSSPAGGPAQGTERIIGWSNMTFNDYDSGIFKKQTDVNPSSALGFSDDSLFINSYCEITIDIDLGYGSGILHLYDGTNQSIQWIRAYKPQDVVETIPGDPNVTHSVTKISAKILKGYYFFVSSTASSMVFNITIRKLNSATPSLVTLRGI